MAELQNELIFIDKLKELKLLNDNNLCTEEDVFFSMRKSLNPKIKKLLSTASKTMTNNPGYPDFMFEDVKNDLIIVFENKEKITKHFSNAINLDDKTKVKQYAVDGALWYASILKEKFNVVAVGVSGKTKDELNMDTYIWNKGSDRFSNQNMQQVFPLNKYRELFQNEKVQNDELAINNLSKIANEINQGMFSYLGVAEAKRYYLVASMLIALDDENFRVKYSQSKSSKELLKLIFSTIKDFFRNIKDSSTIINNLLFITEINDQSPKNEFPYGYIKEIVKKLDNEVFIHYKHSNIDVLSYFFTLFLQYSTSGGAEMGIVLTPPHITNLFSQLANINIDSKIIDPCLGTAGFLSAAWKYIYNQNYSLEEKKKFKHNNLMGAEFSPDIYPAAILNMLINKDGKSHFYLGDSFELAKEGKFESFGANVGFVNPPYSNKVKAEIEFVELMLDSLIDGGIGIAIVPVNAVSKRTKKHNQETILSAKKRILEKNKLLASIQMPINLFYPKATETIVLIFERNISNGNKNNKTWFAKFDDGYKLIKQQKTRIATKETKAKIDYLIKSYRNKSLNNGEFKKEINYVDQWVYTVLRETNYELTMEDLEIKAKEYAIYKFLNDV